MVTEALDRVTVPSNDQIRFWLRTRKLPSGRPMIFRPNSFSSTEINVAPPSAKAVRSDPSGLSPTRTIRGAGETRSGSPHAHDRTVRLLDRLLDSEQEESSSFVAARAGGPARTATVKNATSAANPQG